MTENKRFKNVEEKLDWGTIQYSTYNGEKITDDEIKDLVNQLLEENEELKKENKRLKEILKIKRKEIINRVLALQEITDKYTNEVLFKNNVNPNDAVKQVLKEILSSKVIDDG